VVPLEHRFSRTPDGAVWTQAQLLYPFWAPYLRVFDQVRAVARIREVATVPAGWQRADGPGVSFVAVPYYVGPWQYLRCSQLARQVARSAVGPADAVLIRGGSPISDAIEALLRPVGRPFGLEVVGDPYEALAPGAVRHPLRPFFRWWFTRQLLRQTRYACAAAYVTAHALQSRYPCPGHTTHYSDVQLEASAFAAAHRSWHPRSGQRCSVVCSDRIHAAPARPHECGHYKQPSNETAFTIVSVGSLEQRYKGFHILLDAVADCVRAGLNLRLRLIGDGKHRPELEAQAVALGLRDRVRFLGQLTAGAPVRQQLDLADLFVLPSYTEGLPRAMLEAMARALPCLGSRVGGIPELLSPVDLVPPGDRVAVARKIHEVLKEPARLERMSARNLTKARAYQADHLRDRQIAFYRYLREQTEVWLTRTKRLIHITTVPESLPFLTGQVGYMKAQGFDVQAISSPGEQLDHFAAAEGISAHAISMPRRITPLRDLVAVAQLWHCLQQSRPQIVHAHTPKGGLLGMASAWLARVPVRIYHMHGLPMMTATGLKRHLLKWAERLACMLAHQVLCVSRSVREVAVAEQLCPPEKIKVLRKGSINGVDALEQLNPAKLPAGTRGKVRARYGIPPEAMVAGFVGRVVRDKGLIELTQAWQMLREEFPGLHLLIVGPFESQDPLPADVVALLRGDPRIHLAGECGTMAPLYAAMDLLVLPTYREGFGLVAIEAAAMALPVVATCIPGCVDAVENGVTGMLVPVHEALALADALCRYLRDPELRCRHGAAGRLRVLRDFQQQPLWEAVYQEYTRLLRDKGVPVPRGAATGQAALSL
jgi:glycosyltransferase involved in cell wall biosynthesis